MNESGQDHFQQSVDEKESLVPLSLDVNDDDATNGQIGSGSGGARVSKNRSKTSRLSKCLRGPRSDIAKELVKLAIPVALSVVVSSLQNLQTILFCGHAPNRSANETRVILDAAALATSYNTATGTAVLVGVATACDTLFPQAFGGKNKKALGIIVQQSILIMLLVCMAIAGLWLNSTSILLAVGQDPEVARQAGIYMDIMILGLPGVVGTLVARRYLQCQSITLPSVIAAVISNAVLAVVDYVLVFRLDMGIRGAAIGRIISSWTVAIATLIYIRWKRLHLLTWPGWSFKCLDNWTVFCRLALAGGVMVCLEWWSVEIMIFVAGLLGNVALGAMAVLARMAALAYMASTGMAVATNIVIGSSLGAGEWRRAKATFKVALAINGFNGLVVCCLFVALRHDIGKMFTSDMDIVSGVSEVIPFLIIQEIADYLQGVCAGVIRGAGRQTVGAVSNIVAYYIFALPLGVALALRTALGVRGLWIGVGVGGLFQVVLYLIIIARIDWEKEAILAQQRVKKAVGDRGGRDKVASDSNPVELIAVMETGENGEIRCRITGKADPPLENTDHTPNSPSPLEADSSDQDALIPVSESLSSLPSNLSLEKQTSYTDELFNTTLTPLMRRRLLVRKLLATIVPFAIFAACALVRVLHPPVFPDEDGGDQLLSNVTSNTSTAFLTSTGSTSITVVTS